MLLQSVTLLAAAFLVNAFYVCPICHNSSP